MYSMIWCDDGTACLLQYHQFLTCCFVCVWIAGNCHRRYRCLCAGENYLSTLESHLRLGIISVSRYRDIDRQKGKEKKGKDVDLYSAFHAPGTPSAHVTETRPPDRHLGHRPACNTQPVQWPNNRKCTVWYDVMTPPTTHLYDIVGQTVPTNATISCGRHHRVCVCMECGRAL